jgi:hypothetical protein
VAEQGSGKWWALAALVFVGVGVGIGIVMNRSSVRPAADGAVALPAATPPETTSAPAPGSAQPAPDAFDPRRRVPAPAQSIPEHGRISLTLDEVHATEVFAIGLGMPDEARGDEALLVKMVDVEGRLFEASAPLIEGTGTGLRLEIDSDWLEPGLYLISVSTVEKKPLALRRYVLEVR